MLFLELSRALSCLLRLLFTVAGSEKDSKPYSEILKSISENLDMKTSCGYATILNVSARKRTKLRQMPNITTLAADEFESECEEEDEGISIKLTPDATSCGDESNEEETKLKDVSPVCQNGHLNRVENLQALETPPLSPVQRRMMQSPFFDNLEIADHWVPLQVSYGVPLFDTDLNRQVCEKVISICSIFDGSDCC